MSAPQPSSSGPSHADQKLIPGWVTLLQLMRPGDVWEAYLSPEFAYGHPGKETIPPDSLLIFKIELVSVEPG